MSTVKTLQTISWTEPCRFSPCTGKIQKKELWQKVLPDFLNGRITLGEEAIIRKHFQTRQQWMYEKITSIQFEHTNMNGKEINVMKLIILNSQVFTFGVSNKVDLSQTIEFLIGKGIDILPKHKKITNNADNDES